jgi:hypothetical protein
MNDARLKATGERWAKEDFLDQWDRGVRDGGFKPGARWGNTVLDRAYEARWARLTNQEATR